MFIQQVLISADSTPLFPQAAEWPAKVQAWTSVAGVLIATIGFILVLIQIHELKKAIRAETHGRIYDHAFEVQKVFIDHPEFRKYFYDGVSLQSGGIRRGSLEHAQLLGFAELLADYLEHITLQCDNVPPHVRDAWTNYRRTLTTGSPLLKEFLDANTGHYSANFLALCGDTPVHSKRKGLSRLRMRRERSSEGSTDRESSNE
jgi:hypothetical protein